MNQVIKEENGELTTKLIVVSNFMLMDNKITNCNDCGIALEKNANVLHYGHIFCTKCFNKSKVNCLKCNAKIITVARCNKYKKLVDYYNTYTDKLQNTPRDEANASFTRDSPKIMTQERISAAEKEHLSIHREALETKANSF